MTYGWALVVIVVVIAALVVLVGNPSGNATCNAPGSTFSVRNQYLTGTTIIGGDQAWALKVSNLTGRSLSGVHITGVSWSPIPNGGTVPTALGTDYNISVGGTRTSQITTGQEFDLGIAAPAGMAEGEMTGKKYQTIINISYYDGDFNRSTSITCNGTAQ
ncbi:MAG: hypothetical protein J4215_06405 [Candidatus Diapherotrites archaeon]|uniref:Uncharacterized protein n=1 Tax=Candidatus Iainarchaeum sp. TaxID=3101447 RepID=A0A8T4LG02_9ARCH|nr:hypothetical protein [Candidatus Diapherotrites archaeon]